MAGPGGGCGRLPSCADLEFGESGGDFGRERDKALSWPDLIRPRCEGVEDGVGPRPPGRRGEEGGSRNFTEWNAEKEHRRGEMFGRVKRAVFGKDMLRPGDALV